MKKFIKEKYNILIPVFLIIVILIAVFLYTREYKNNRYAKTEEVDVYQYFSGLKLEYKAKISRNKKNVILKYEPKDEVVNLSSIPIYIKGKDNVIFPKAMSIIFPIKDEVYSISSLAEVYKKNNLYEEYKLELEYCYVRYIYATFIKQASKYNYKDYMDAVDSAISNVRKNFPKYKKNKYFYKSLKGIYMLMFNKRIAKIIYKKYNK